jgi:hypothetical protein
MDRISWRETHFLYSLQKNLQDYTISGCDRLVEFPYLVGLRSLKIYACNLFTILPALPSALGYLEISFCGELELLQIQEDKTSNNLQFPLYEMKVNNCWNLSKVDFFSKSLSL